MGDPAKAQAKRDQRAVAQAERKQRREAKWESRAATVSAPLDKRIDANRASTARIRESTEQRKAAASAARAEARAAGAGWFGRQKAAHEATRGMKP